MPHHDRVPFPATYEIVVDGILDEHWRTALGMTITHGADDLTTVTGEVADQAALRSVLTRLQDLGLIVMSVRRVEQR